MKDYQPTVPEMPVTLERIHRQEKEAYRWGQVDKFSNPAWDREVELANDQTK